MPGIGWTPAIPTPGFTPGYGYGMGYVPHPYEARGLLGILNANRKIRKRTDTDVAFTREYSRVMIFHRERECTN